MSVKGSRVNKRYNVAVALSATCVSWWFSIWAFRLSPNIEWTHSVISMAVILTVMPIAMILPGQLTSPRIYRIMVECLGYLGQADSLPTICSALGYRPWNKAAKIALARIVETVRPVHYGTLPCETTSALCNALPKSDDDTILVILKALSIIGDGRAIKAVERLAQKPPTPEIGEAASVLLQVLRQRDEESKSQSQLLRASERDKDKEHELVRPAAANNADEPDLLLRAVGRENEHT